MTVLGAKKEPSVCALFGNGTIYLLGTTIYLYYTLRRCVEALTRAGEYDRSMLPRAVAMFEVSYFFDLSYPLNHLSQEFLLYLNHLGLCTEEISEAGEG